ncbi:hypothetical protein PDE_08614 [Penicillium oxalicum 114-2]|uniref:FAD-binding FR-type domain-containing protein n=1 Tax=Penicillium oxalicum (strain 114-2 / CGMCC 5302) TaxID=933388 RepID=S8BEZ0_PENO1|nr:hypothetical protein PDE_08614 [Penicillium oxalicum 114-2]
MTSRREDSIPHELRTAAEPRQNTLYPVRLSRVEQANSSVRLLQLTLPRHDEAVNENNQEPFSFLPGQWLDVHIPSISTAGGFTITSTPADAQVLPLPEDGEDADPSPSPSSSTFIPGREPFVELAVQEAPTNPPAAWLWRPKAEILGQPLNIRVGGSFVWPPTGVALKEIRNVVMIAGGVGINPLISILTHLNNQGTQELIAPLHVHLLYSSRVPQNHDPTPSIEDSLDQILFLPRIRQIIRSQQQSHRLRVSLDLFLTTASSSGLTWADSPADCIVHFGRMQPNDLLAAVRGGDGQLDPRQSVAYVCGPPQMTDEMVDTLTTMLGEKGEQRVFYEKWW